MYNEQSKIALESRIGWSNPILPNTEIALTPENVVSVSGRYFNSFHQLAIVENVFYTIPNKDVTNDNLNEFLTNLKKQVVLQVLNRVFDGNIYAVTKSTNEFVSLNYSTDYSDLIIEKQSLFDEAIGYLMASKCMQLFLTTSRSNSKERTIQTSYQVLKVELEGVRDENGKVIANGVSQMADLAIANIISILFPIEKKSVAKLFGRKVW